MPGRGWNRLPDEISPIRIFAAVKCEFPTLGEVSAQSLVSAPSSSACAISAVVAANSPSATPDTGRLKEFDCVFHFSFSFGSLVASRITSKGKYFEAHASNSSATPPISGLLSVSVSICFSFLKLRHRAAGVARAAAGDDLKNCNVVVRRRGRIRR